MSSSRGYLIGVDLGGTKILGAAFSLGAAGGGAKDGATGGEGGGGGAKGKARAAAPAALAVDKRKTPRSEDPEAVVEALLDCVGAIRSRESPDWGPCLGLGVAVPGPLDRAAGLVRCTPNLGFLDYPLAARLRDATGLPVALENDVQAGVLGELRAGALRGVDSAVGVFVGTGVGGALVIGGRLYRGSTGSAGEVGHMILHEGGALCGCGNYGCLEALASRTAMAKDGVALAASGKAPALAAAVGADFSRLKSSAFEEALEAGDEAVGRLVDRAAFWLGVGMCNLVNVLNPEAILLGGGVVARFGPRIRKVARAVMAERLMPGLAATAKVLLSELGDLAVPAGAAFAAVEAAEAAAAPPPSAGAAAGRAAGRRAARTR